jgi:uncharacterized protein (TIGR02145 family)
VKNSILIFLGLLVALIFISSCERTIGYPLYINGGGVIDAEGNEYETVIIGDQEWMAENLKTDLYCNGDSIPYSGDDVRVKVYDNDPENEVVFGKLYNFQAVLDTAGLCPCGWHIPTELEYAVLIDYLGGYENAMRSMKSSGSIDRSNGLWIEINGSGRTYSGTNASGFNALPAGFAGDVQFYKRDTMALFWATQIEGSDAIMYEIGDNDFVAKFNFDQPHEKDGIFMSVRCIKDL